MTSNERIAQLLVESGGYRDLAEPVVLAGGDLGIYYVNAERLLMDGGEWNHHKGSSTELMNYAVRRTRENPQFFDVIERIATDAYHRFNALHIPLDRRAVSGGETRDWIFSGPVAHSLRSPHISVYKDGSLYRASASLTGAPFFSREAEDISGLHAIHIADLLTVGSSAYDPNQNPPTGWIPYVRNAGGQVTDFFAIVDRMQKGPENLRQANVDVQCFVTIDEAFLRQHSNNPDAAVNYMKNPRKWGEDYLREHGVDALMKFFDPNGKMDHGRKFVQKYGSFLRENGRWEELETKARDEYGVDINCIALS